jgi:hypothetical protein
MQKRKKRKDEKNQSGKEGEEGKSKNEGHRKQNPHPIITTTQQKHNQGL